MKVRKRMYEMEGVKLKEHGKRRKRKENKENGEREKRK